MSGQAEHFLAYFLTALVLGTRVGIWVYCIPATLALCTYAGAMEIMQIWIPDRNAQFIDFAASSCGAVSGSLCYILILRLLRWSKGKRLGDVG
jgi:VanZ family protein